MKDAFDRSALPGENQRTILYYPHIAIPPGPWIRRAIFYWDQIASIVPKDWEQRYGQFSQELEYLRADGQFRPIDPGDAISVNYSEYQEMVSAFQEHVNEQIDRRGSTSFGRPFSSSSSDFRRRSEREGLARLHSNDWWPDAMHVNKASSNVFQFLEREGLARPHSNDWWHVEPETLSLYMSMLASFLASVDRWTLAIGTDQQRYEEQAIGNARHDADRLECIDTYLSEILPVPDENVPIEQIIEFKRENRVALLNFRTLLDDFQSKIGKGTNQTEVRQATVEFSENLEVGITELSERLQEQRIGMSWGTLKTLASFGNIGLIGASPFLEQVPIAVRMGALVISGTIQIGTSIVGNRGQANEIRRGSPFSYVYEAQRLGLAS